MQTLLGGDFLSDESSNSIVNVRKANLKSNKSLKLHTEQYFSLPYNSILEAEKLQIIWNETLQKDFEDRSLHGIMNFFE